MNQAYQAPPSASQPAQKRPSDPSNRHARMYPSYRQALSPTAYLVLGTLREYIFDDECRSVDYAWLTDATGLSYGAVCRAMHELTDHGFIHRERESSGRGNHYRVTMLPPPEKRSSDPPPFFAPETNHKRITNESPVIRSAPAESPAPTPQTGEILPPIMLADHHKQQKQHADEHAMEPEYDQEDTASADSPEWEPHQRELHAALQQANAGAVAAQIVQARPDLTAADLHLDLAAAEARPTIHSPIGLVCAAWLAGSRVTAPRAPQDADPPVAPPSDPPTATEQFLLDQGFSARAAHEFRQFDLAAVQAACERTFSPLDTSHERNQRIGKLVVRWRRQPPTGGDAPAHDQPALDDPRPIADEDDPPVAECAPPPVDTSDPDAVWQAALAALQGMMPRSAYTTIFLHTRLLELRDDLALIGCKTAQQKEQIEHHHTHAVRQVLAETLARPVQVRVLLC